MPGCHEIKEFLRSKNVEFEEIDLAANKEARDIVIAKTGNEVIKSGLANRVSFGVLFLANPDLPDRFGKNALLNSADPLTFYTGEEKGYTDYPALGAGTQEKLQVKVNKVK